MRPSQTLFSALLFAALSVPAAAQPETMAWGNITGIRSAGNLLELNSSMCVAEPGWAAVSRTGRERQVNTYHRDGKQETVRVALRPARELREAGVAWRLLATEVVRETGPGSAAVDLQYAFEDDASVEGAFYCFELPASRYRSGSAFLVDAVPPAPERVSLAPGGADVNEYMRATAKGIRFVGQGREVTLAFAEPAEILIRDDRRQNNYDLQVYVTVIAGKGVARRIAASSIAISAAGDADPARAVLALDAAHPGQLFDGFGGNFRLQSPRTDPQVIRYTLENMRVAWGRVEMPWSLWQPQEEVDALEAARAGTVNPRVVQAMEMARRLARQGMPVIVSAWSAPEWATLGPRGFPRPTRPAAAALAGPPLPGIPNAFFEPDGPRGNPLDPAKVDRIKRSIAGYLVFLKERYGVEAAMFSFNESDLGINVRQTAREHAGLIKTLGAYFASRGLATKLALGDTSDADPIDFIRPALEDPEAAKYVGAVDFHSWRGCTDGMLARWRDAARALNVPLIVAEGSTDAAAWRYPGIFLEPSFALYEINLYTRILAIAQPRSILQWQLTADYSVLAGGNIFGDPGPLRPTRRFWNLKQLASTPPRSFALPIDCGRPELNCAAFGNIAESQYTIHVVNNGGARPATLAGLPNGITEVRVWVTDDRRGMEELKRVAVAGGKAELTLDPMSFTTLIGVEAAPTTSGSAAGGERGRP